MGAETGIEWTDATVNFWWGCTKVGPGCDFCYAEKWDARFGDSHWGVGVPRRKIKGAIALLHRLDNDYSEWAADYYAAKCNAPAFGLPMPTFGPRRRVFIQSMSDLFDLEVDIEWFREAWGTIESCNRIDVQIVTKRIGAVEKRLAAIGRTTWPKHAGLIISVVNQAEADRDVPRLLALKAKLGIPWVGLSMEPLLGPVDLIQAGAIETDSVGDPTPGTGESFTRPRIDWCIVGGESGPSARPMHETWAESLRDQCQAAGVAFFMKQMTKKAPIPEHLMVREFPDAR